MNTNLLLKCLLLFSSWQINRAPSFGTDQKIDYDVKKGVLLNALKLLNIRYWSSQVSLTHGHARRHASFPTRSPLRLKVQKKEKLTGFILKDWECLKIPIDSIIFRFLNQPQCFRMNLMQHHSAFILL